MRKSILSRTRLIRLLLYVSGTSLAVFSAIVIPAVGIWHATRSQSDLSDHPHTLRLLVAGITVGSVLIVLRNYLEYRRIVYDPHWAMNFQDRFDRMEAERSTAAKILRDSKAELGNGITSRNCLRPFAMWN